MHRDQTRDALFCVCSFSLQVCCLCLCVDRGAFTYLLLSLQVSRHHERCALTFIIIVTSKPRGRKKTGGQTGDDRSRTFVYTFLKWLHCIPASRLSLSTILTAPFGPLSPSPPLSPRVYFFAKDVRLNPTWSRSGPAPLLLLLLGLRRVGWRDGERASGALLPARLKSLHLSNRRSVSLMGPDVTPDPPLHLN